MTQNSAILEQASIKINTDQIKADFPGLNTRIDDIPVTYLDSAASSLKPQVMIDAVNRYYSSISSNVHRGKNQALESVSDSYEQARYKVAELIGCNGNEVVFVRNTTEGVNLVAQGLALSQNDDVIVFSDAHHANLLPWMELATIHTVKCNQQGSIDLEHYRQLLAERKPKLVAMTHCSNVTGIYAPIEQMITMAKAAGAVTFIDAAQSVPHRRINVTALDCDFLTFSAHKMAGPTGIGVLYGKQQQLNQLKPLNLGGGMVDWVASDHYRLRKIPHRFEAGTPHIAGAYGLGAAIDYLSQLGFDNIARHDTAMGQYMLAQASQRQYLKVVSPDQTADRGAVLSMYFPATKDLDDLARILSDSYGLMCRHGHLCAQPYVTEQTGTQVLRISAYIYTDKADIDRFFNALDELAAMMLG